VEIGKPNNELGQIISDMVDLISEFQIKVNSKSELASTMRKYLSIHCKDNVNKAKESKEECDRIRLSRICACLRIFINEIE